MSHEFMKNELTKDNTFTLFDLSKNHTGSDFIVDSARRFELIGEQLLNLTRSTEQDFLQIGNDIGEFSVRARELADMIKKANILIFGEDLNNIISESEKMIERMNKWLLSNFKELENKIQVLEQILELIKKNNIPLKQLARLVTEFRILGITIRIECGRLDDEKSNFTSLARDVNNLSDMVSSKLDDINAGIQSSVSLLAQTKEKIINFKLQQGKQAQTVIVQIVDCLQVLKRKHNESEQIINCINRENDEITTGVGDIVSSLQFHDIVRQKIEHVIEAFEELSSSVKAGCGNPHMDSYEIAGKISDVCELQLYHLKSTHNEIMLAVESLIENETRIESISRDMTQNTFILLQSAAENKSSFFNNTKKSIENIKKFLFDNAQIKTDLSNSITRISEMSGEMVEFIKDIRLIGRKITLIALNAIINSEHLDIEGVAIGILAEGIQRLAYNTKEQIQDVAGYLNEISVLAGGLMEGKTTMEQKENIKMGVNDMISDLNNVLNNLNNIFENANQHLLGIEVKGKSFVRDMESAIKQITIHHIFDRILSESISSLNQVIKETKSFIPDYKGENKKVNLESINNNYTMMSERNVHFSFLSDEQKNNTYSPVEQAVFDSGNELGDNVELF